MDPDPKVPEQAVSFAAPGPVDPLLATRSSAPDRRDLVPKGRHLRACRSGRKLADHFVGLDRRVLEQARNTVEPGPADPRLALRGSAPGPREMDRRVSLLAAGRREPERRASLSEPDLKSRATENEGKQSGAFVLGGGV